MINNHGYRTHRSSVPTPTTPLDQQNSLAVGALDIKDVLLFVIFVFLLERSRTLLAYRVDVGQHVLIYRSIIQLHFRPFSPAFTAGKIPAAVGEMDQIQLL